MTAPGYSSRNPAITEWATLRGASAWADCGRVTMRAMACESTVVLNPWPAVHHPNHRYMPLPSHSRDYNICCCQKKKKSKKKRGGGGAVWGDSGPHRFSPCQTYSFCQPALHSASGGLPELLQSLMCFCEATSQRSTSCPSLFFRGPARYSLQMGKGTESTPPPQDDRQELKKLLLLPPAFTFAPQLSCLPLI